MLEVNRGGFAALGLALMTAFAGQAARAEEPVKIGFAADLTGACAALSEDEMNAVKIAVDELNAHGVTIGGKKVRFELMAEDDAADPKQGTAAAQKLCDAKVNGVVGHLNSGTTIPAAKVYSQCGLPMVTPSASTTLPSNTPNSSL